MNESKTEPANDNCIIVRETLVTILVPNPNRSCIDNISIVIGASKASDNWKKDSCFAPVNDLSACVSDVTLWRRFLDTESKCIMKFKGPIEGKTIKLSL